MILGFHPVTLSWIGLATLAAFIVRGLSGFGSALIGIGALTIVLPPAQVVPAFFGLELLTTVNLLPSVWRQIDWRSLRWVIAGCALTTPIGLTALAHLNPNPMRLVVSACLATIALLMLSGVAQRFTPRSTPGPLGALATGGAAGVLNGAAGIPGPPAIVFYFATTGTAVSRATLIAFFLFTDSYGLAWAGSTGLLAGVGWRLVAVALPFSLAGIWIGQRLYVRLDEAQLRRLIWALLAVLGGVGCISAVLRLTAAGGSATG
jgi:uncharacterized membrane protein YfcA